LTQRAAGPEEKHFIGEESVLKKRSLLHARGQNLFVVNFDFNAQRRPQVRALHDGASHP
jgi:hypothetical protein